MNKEIKSLLWGIISAVTGVVLCMLSISTLKNNGDQNYFRLFFSFILVVLGYIEIKNFIYLQKLKFEVLAKTLKAYPQSRKFLDALLKANKDKVANGEDFIISVGGVKYKCRQVG